MVYLFIRKDNAFCVSSATGTGLKGQRSIPQRINGIERIRMGN